MLRKFLGESEEGLSEAGRLCLLLGEYADEVWKCVRCGFCNSVCPTSNASFSYMASKTSRGRLIMLQAYFSDALSLSPLTKRFQKLVDLCFGCRRCLEICPAGIRIPQLMWRLRYAGNRAGERGDLDRFFVAHYGMLERIGSRFPGISNLISQSRPGRFLLEILGGIDRRAPFPKFRGKSLEDRIRGRDAGNGGRGRLAYFIDVFTNYHEQELGMKVVEALGRLGYRVYAPEQREAGTLLLEEGLLEKAERVARFNVESLYREVEKGARIFTTSPAAYLALKQDYPELLGNHKSKKVAENTLDVVEILSDEYRRGRLNFTDGESKEVIYHHSCFTKASGLTKKIREILRSAGYRVREVEECCGVAGLWGLRKKHYEEALDVGSKLFQQVKGFGLPVFSQSETCRLQIRHHAGVETRHPVEGVLKKVKR